MVSRTNLLEILVVLGMFISAPVLAAQLHDAVENGDIDQVQMLIANGADVNANDSRRRTPLHLASQEGHTAAVEILIANGADVNANRSREQTPLHDASNFGHTATVELLIANGADVNANDNIFQKPLHLASQEGHTAAVELLIANGADVNANDSRDRTPLHLASKKGHTAAVELLITNGADVNERSGDGLTPLDYAEDGGHTTTAILLFADSPPHAADCSTQANVAFSQEPGLAPPNIVEAINKAGSVILDRTAQLVGLQLSGTLVTDSENPLVVTFAAPGKEPEEVSFEADGQEVLWKAALYADNLETKLVDLPGSPGSPAPVFNMRFKLSGGVLRFSGSITYAGHETTVLSGDTYSAYIGEQVQFSDNTELKVDDTIYVCNTGNWYVRE